MTCPGCERDVTLLGGFCGHSEAVISRTVNDVIEELDELVGSVVDVHDHVDGYLHVRIDREEGEG